MGGYKDRLARLMRGRNGVDALYYALAVLFFCLALVQLILRTLAADIALGALMWAALALMVFRAFSKDLPRRRAENERFLKGWGYLKEKCFLTVRRFRQIRTHRFRKCPYCKKVLRLPRKVGSHFVVCPVCGRRFEVHIRW